MSPHEREAVERAKAWINSYPVANEQAIRDACTDFEVHTDHANAGSFAVGHLSGYAQGVRDCIAICKSEAEMNSIAGVGVCLALADRLRTLLPKEPDHAD
jgi:hypothetical protein